MSQIGRFEVTMSVSVGRVGRITFLLKRFINVIYITSHIPPQ